ncbi:His/Glu/Gln/Arg/opine family amino acid ABC transporter permease subunit [Bradyrhizobium sp. GM5.1]
MYQWDFGILWSYRWLFLNGLGVTVGFTVVIVVLGLVFGLFGAFGTLSRFRAVRLLALTFIEAFRCTPILVQLIWFYYALPILAGVEMTPITASALALSLYGGSFYSEIIRGGIISIDRGPVRSRCRARYDPGTEHAAHRAAAGDQAHDPGADEPVDHPVQEHLAGLGAGGA